MSLKLSSPPRGRQDSGDQRRRWVSETALLGCALVLEIFSSGVLLGPLYPWSGGPAVPRWIIVGIIVVQCLVLTRRRRHPMVVLVVIIASSAALTFWVDGAQPFFFVPVALFAAAAHASTSRSLVALALSLGYVLVPLWAILNYDNISLGDRDWIFPVVGFSSILAVVYALARRDRAQRARTASLRDDLVERVERAAQAERQRIARELHDIVAHSVSAMMMQAAGARAMTQSVARDLTDDPRVQAVEGALGSIETTGAQSMRELHRLLGILRNDEPVATGSALDLDRDLSPSTQPDLGELDQLLQVSRGSGLLVEMHEQGTPRQVDPSVGNAAYRVVQESLTNALKHAGRGAVVDVYLAWQEQELQVQVRCRGTRDAPRPDTPNGGTGLRGLRERVNLVGGTFDAGWAGDAFVGTASLPVRPRDGGAPLGAGDATRHTDGAGWE